jgi:hypothetical protein
LILFKNVDFIIGLAARAKNNASTEMKFAEAVEASMSNERLGSPLCKE